MRILIHSTLTFLLSTIITCSLIFGISAVYNSINDIDVNYTTDLDQIYGAQESQLLARLETDNTDEPLEIKNAVALGGSTTWGSAMMPNNQNVMPIKHTWPYLLDQVALDYGDRIKTANLGAVGASSECTHKILRYFFKPNLKVFIVHNGYNDLPIFTKLEKDSYTAINTDIKTDFCMYETPLHKILYDMKRLLIHHAPMFRRFLDGGMVNGDRDVYLGFELTETDQFVKLNNETIKEFSEKRTKKFLDSNKKLIEFASQHNAKVLFILEPEIEPTFTPNGSSFRYENSAGFLKQIHIDQQNALKEFLTKFDPEIVNYVDARSPLRGNEEFFYDEIHLNEAGNTELSIVIYKRLSQLGWL